MDTFSDDAWTFEQSLDRIEAHYSDLERPIIDCVRAKIRVHLLGRPEPDFLELLEEILAEHRGIGGNAVSLLVHEVFELIKERFDEVTALKAVRPLTAAEKQEGQVYIKMLDDLQRTVALVLPDHGFNR